MTEPRTAPYGTWSSPIGADLLATAGVGLMEPWLDGGAAYWLEGASGRREAAMRPGPWRRLVVPGGRDAGRVQRPDDRARVRRWLLPRSIVARCTSRTSRTSGSIGRSGGADPEPITPDTGGRHRYADGRVTPDGSLMVCVRERHEDDGVVNELVAVPLDGR